MSKLDRLCRILLDEQDLIKKRYTLSKKKLDEFNKLWKDINQDHEDAKILREYNTYDRNLIKVLVSSQKDRQIVKRLEEFVKEYRSFEFSNTLAYQDLQKILEGKK